MELTGVSAIFIWMEIAVVVKTIIRTCELDAIIGGGKGDISCIQGRRNVVNSGVLISQQENFSMVKIESYMEDF